VRDSAGVRIVESAAPEWHSGAEWRLADRPAVEIRGDGANADELPLDPASVFRMNESIIVADGMYVGHDALLVFDAAGNFVRRLSRSGEGPCEFGQLWWAQPYRGDSLAAYDYADHTVAIMTSGGGCAREIRLPDASPPIARGTYGYSPGADGAFADGAVLAQPTGSLDISGGPGPAWYRHAFLRVPPDGEGFDSLGVFEISRQYWNGSRSGMYPFGGSGSRVITADGFFFGTGETFEIRRYDTAGTLTAIFRRAFTPPPVTEEERSAFESAFVERIRLAGYDHGGDAAAERARRTMQETEFALAKPAYSALLVDAAGNLWVQEYRPYLWFEMGLADQPVDWSVFDPAGRWLGGVRLPGRFQPKTIGTDEILGVWKDDDGLAHVRVYALAKRTDVS
jgi:hypothetical protein